MSAPTVLYHREIRPWIEPFGNWLEIRATENHVECVTDAYGLPISLGTRQDWIGACLRMADLLAEARG